MQYFAVRHEPTSKQLLVHPSHANVCAAGAACTLRKATCVQPRRTNSQIVDGPASVVRLPKCFKIITTAVLFQICHMSTSSFPIRADNSSCTIKSASLWHNDKLLHLPASRFVFHRRRTETDFLKTVLQRIILYLDNLPYIFGINRKLSIWPTCTLEYSF